MRSRTIAVAGLVAALAAAGAGVAQAAPTPVQIPGSVNAAVAAAPSTGTVPANQQLTVQLWLKGNQAGAESFANAVSDPKNPAFRHYTSPNAYTTQFGASAATANAVSSWLTQQGFSQVKTDAQRAYVQASAPASTVQQAFAVQLKHFSVAGKSIMSNDRDVSLSPSIANDVLAVTGLNNTQPKPELAAAPRTDVPNCSNYFGQNHQTVPEIDGVTSVPTRVCGYTGTQLRAAYGMNNTNTGKGVTVAYIEAGQPDKMFQTLTTWAKAGGLPAPRSANYAELLLGSGAACGNPFDIEEQLDIESGYAMAPDQHQLMVGADSCDTRDDGNQALFDALNVVLDGTGNSPLATIASNSWGPATDETSDPADIPVMHQILLRAAGEGVGMYFASGDEPGVGTPQDDPYAIGVGSTSLGLDAKNNLLFETGWSTGEQVVNADGSGYTDNGIQDGASGGVSTVFDEPAYQRGVVPKSMATQGRKTPGRTVPDVSAEGDQLTGMSVGITEPGTNGGPDVYSTDPFGGASLSAPLFAGMVAAAQQGQPRAFGFANPLFYLLSQGNAFRDVLPFTASTPVAYRFVYNSSASPAYVGVLDDQNPADTKQVTAKGYDTMTGLGTPNGQKFINELRLF
ncbi:MAG TPA: protease pro-enzyme activation domain-containing protein [Pseudonocardiaceae bacterium]